MNQPTQPRLNHVACLGTAGLHRMAYWEWGDPANPRVLVCVHGLSRQGRDFDVLAQDLCDHYRVVCPDVVGRGQSDWLADPAGYAIPAYVADMVTLLARWLTVGLPVTLGLRRWRLPTGAGRVLTWGGLRGGISVALALSLPPGPERETLLALTYCVVVFSILVQGLTIGRVVKRAIRG